MLQLWVMLLLAALYYELHIRKDEASAPRKARAPGVGSASSAPCTVTTWPKLWFL